MRVRFLHFRIRLARDENIQHRFELACPGGESRVILEELHVLRVGGIRRARSEPLVRAVREIPDVEDGAMRTGEVGGVDGVIAQKLFQHRRSVSRAV